MGTVKKQRPLSLTTVDGTPVKSGKVTHEAHLRMLIGEHEEVVVFDVADIGDDNMILGISWLRKHNPTINWERSTLEFTSVFCQTHCLPVDAKRTARRAAYKVRRRKKAAEAEREARVAAPEAVKPAGTVGKRTNGRFIPSERTRSLLGGGFVTPETKPEALRGLKKKKNGRVKAERERRQEAVRVAKVVIDAAMADARERERHVASTSSGKRQETVHQSEGPLGGDINTESVNISPRGKPFPVNPSKDEMTGLCFEQMYDETRESLRAAAGHSFSAELAEADARKKAAPPRTSEQMVPPEFHEFLDVFDKGKAERLPAHKPHDLGIDLEGPIPPAGRLYQMSSDELRILKEFVDENLAKGYIRQSKAPTGAPVFFVKKKDGSLRMVVDYRALNSVTRKDSYPIPLTAELLDRFRAAKVFTTLDMRAGYYNVRIREGDEWKTSFRTRYGQFEFLVMQFGLCNAPAAFQRMVNELFQDLVDVSMVLYLDDIIIFSEDESKHDDQVREVLRRLREADLFLKPEKCAFRTKEVDYLGLKITPGSISMDPVKVSGVTDWPTPQNLRHVNQFLGFCNFYRRFVEDYARIARPLERLKGKTVPWRWGEEEEAAFRELKAAFVAAPILMMPDMNAPFVVETDASDFAIGAILSQADESGELRPVAYYSKAMSAAERNYQVHDKELLAAIRALEEWRPYLEGNAHKVKIFSDHRNLEYFMTMKDLTRRQARWSLFLSRFDFTIVHHPGRLSVGPDQLSRRRRGAV